MACQTVAEPETQQKKETVAIDALVRLIIALEPQKCDEGMIREVFGETASTSLAEIAGVFGVSHATVKHTWRANGMPGDGKRRIFQWADVLIWYLKREKSNELARGVDEFTKRRRAAEADAAEADARIKTRRAEVAEGEFISLASTRACIKGVLNVARDALMSIPKKWSTRFPAKYAVEWTGELESDVRAGLTMIAETPIEDVLERIRNDDEEN